MENIQVVSGICGWSFSFTVAAATYVSIRCYTPPYNNHRPVRSDSKQARLPRPNLVWFLKAYQKFVGLCGLAHLTFSIFRPRGHSLICPYAETINDSLFTWNTYTCIALLLTMSGGILRIVAYAQLGANFTFELGKPSSLITHGLYRYVRHPSYTGGWICTSGFILLLARVDGGLGCFVPSALIIPLTAINVALVMGMMAAVFTRVSKEEAMMRHLFKEDWDQYALRTQKFVPGIY